MKHEIEPPVNGSMVSFPQIRRKGNIYL